MADTTKVRSWRERLDSWMNAITGLGTDRDKLTGFTFQRSGVIIPPETLEGLFHEDDAAAKIVEKPVEQMLRPWFGISVGDDELDAAGLSPADVETRTLDALDELGAREAFADALVWEGVFGGAAILVGALDGRPVSEPLDFDRIEKVSFLNVLDARDVIPWTWFTDPLATHFGEPETYKILRTWSPGFRAKREVQQPPAEIMVHASRLIVFPGLRSSRRERQARNGWGVSRLSRSYNALRQFNANWAAVGNILQDASQGVFKIQGLIDLIAGGGKEALLTRLQLMDMSRSVSRSILVDAETEDFSRRDTTMSGLPQLLDQTGARLAAAAEMPLTVLMGQSPAGMNATGESDSRNWYDRLDAERNNRFRPRLEQLLRILFRAKSGPTGGREPTSWTIKFPPLWTPTAREKGEIHKMHAETDEIRIRSGVLTAEEVALARFRPEGYSDEIDGIDLEAREAALEAYLEKLESGEGELPALPATGLEEPHAPAGQKPPPTGIPGGAPRMP